MKRIILGPPTQPSSSEDRNSLTRDDSSKNGSESGQNSFVLAASLDDCTGEDIYQYTIIFLLKLTLLTGLRAILVDCNKLETRAFIVEVELLVQS